MKNNVINFSDLGRKEVRCIVYKNEVGVVIVEYNQEEIKKLQVTLDKPMIVYNINPEIQIKLQAIVSKAGEGVYKDKKDIVVTAKELILDYLPLCTNIILNLDPILDKEIIDGIVNDPMREFELVIDEVSKIVTESSRAYADNITAFSKLSKKDREKIIKESTPQIEEVLETEEEKELREAEESLLAIKERIKNKNIKVEDVVETEIVKIEE